MRKQEIAELLAAAILCWASSSSGSVGPVSRNSSPSSIGIQLSQVEGVGGGYTTGGPVTARGPLFELATAACVGKSAGDSCSFAAPDGQTVTGTCITAPDTFICAPPGAMLHYETGGNGSQQQDENR